MVSISAQINSIPMLNGMNFKVWKEAIVIVLGYMDLDLVFRVEKLILTLNNLQEKRFWTLFFRVKDKENIKEYIIEMSNLLAKLKSLKLELGEYLIVHLILISLPTHFGYNYLYLIHEKSQSLHIFKSFKAKVELQLGKKIKVIKYDRGGEYYDRYDGSGEQHPRSFALFLRKCGIVPQYTMPGKPSMNGVTERRNRTLKDMMRKTTPIIGDDAQTIVLDIVLKQDYDEVLP
ncbi:hypothetical protein CR513_00296, partial [Mucuna pruriens]